MSPRVVSICDCSAKIQRDFSLSVDDSTSCRANPGIRCLGGAAFEQCFEGFSLPFDQRSDANDGVRSRIRSYAAARQSMAKHFLCFNLQRDTALKMKIERGGGGGGGGGGGVTLYSGVQHRTWLKSTTIKRGQSQERG
jgi:hypothetical protein